MRYPYVICFFYTLTTIVFAISPSPEQLQLSALAPFLNQGIDVEFLQTGSRSTTHTRRVMNCAEELGLVMDPTAHDKNVKQGENSLVDLIAKDVSLQSENVDEADLKTQETIFKWERSDRYQMTEKKTTLGENLRDIYFLTEICSQRSEANIAMPLTFTSFPAARPSTGPPEADQVYSTKGSEQLCADTANGCNANTPTNQVPVPDANEACFAERPFRSFAGWCMNKEQKLVYVWSRGNTNALNTFIDPTSTVFTAEAGKTEGYQLLLLAPPNGASSKNHHGVGGTAEFVSRYNKEGFLHEIVSSILGGLQFLHEQKGLALLSFKPDSIQLSESKHKPLLTDFSQACFFNRPGAPYPCVPVGVADETTKLIYEPLQVYGYDTVNPNYNNWWKPDLFLLAMQLVIPLLTGGVINPLTSTEMCGGTPLTVSENSLYVNTGNWGGAVSSIQPCAAFVHHVFDYFSPRSLAEPGCNCGVKTMRNWKDWHAPESVDNLAWGSWLRKPVTPLADFDDAVVKSWITYAQAPELLKPIRATKEQIVQKRKESYQRLFKKLVAAHTGDTAVVIPCAKKDSDNLVLMPWDTPTAPAEPVFADKLPKSLFQLLVDPQYRLWGLDGKQLASNTDAPRLMERRSQLACKWVMLILDLITCHEVRLPAGYLRDRLAADYKEECMQATEVQTYGVLPSPCDIVVAKPPSTPQIAK